MQSTDPKQEFRELLKASSWSQAEAARQLAMTPSALSQIVRVNSPVKPSPVTLRLFKLLLLREKPEALQAAPRLARSDSPSAKWETDLIRALRKIPPKTREPLLEAFARLIELSMGGDVLGTKKRKPKQNREKK